MLTVTNFIKGIQSQRGFALVTAILACVILMALAILVMNMSTNDLRVSGRNVGEKTALHAAESGVQVMLRNFDYVNRGAITLPTDTQVDPSSDPSAYFTITDPALPITSYSMSGFSMAGGQKMVRYVYPLESEGRSTTHDTRVILEFGVANGPNPGDTDYR